MYDDVYLIKGLIEEAEIANFTEDDIKSLGKLLDDKLAAKVTAMIDRLKNSSIRTSTNSWAVHLCERVDLFEKLIGEKARKYTFHLEVKEKNLIEIINKMNIETAYEIFSEDVQGAIDLLEFLTSNRKLWMNELDPRQKADYEDFLNKMLLLGNRAGMMSQNLEQVGIKLNICTELDRRIKDNRSIFYGVNETTRKTGMGIVIKKESDIGVVLHGFLFRRRVKSENLRQSEWRRI